MVVRWTEVAEERLKNIFVYFVDEKLECVVIATIWDCRRNPLSLMEDVL